MISASPILYLKTMTVEYTSQQVLALAPDASSQKSGQELANTRKWHSIARGGMAVWGECHGSGSKPYQTRVDLNGPAFKCSCPSRKFPCKHGIGLLLLYSLSPGSFREADIPPWVQDWLDSRQQRQKKEENRTPEQLEEAKLAREKRRLNRMASVSAGIEELELFLRDLIRQGVGHLKTEGYAYFESRAARLVDAQAPGLARLIRECASLTSSQGNWQEPLLNRIATIYLIARSFKQIAHLPPDMEADVMAAVGFNQSQDALLTEEGIRDHWYVIGQSIYTEDRLRVQKSWLIGADTKRKALVLSFAHGTAPFDVLLVPGHSYEAELVFYPSRYPLRALIKTKNSEAPPAMPEGELSIEEALGQYSEALAQIPWLEEMPFLLSGQTLVSTPQTSAAAAGQVTTIRSSSNRTNANISSANQSSHTIFLTDQMGAGLPLNTRGVSGWQLMAFASGHPVSVFGEFDGISLKPLAAINHESGKYLRLAQGEA
jgi:hypothetical protein